MKKKHHRGEKKRNDVKIIFFLRRNSTPVWVKNEGFLNA